MMFHLRRALTLYCNVKYFSMCIPGTMSIDTVLDSSWQIAYSTMLTDTVLDSSWETAYSTWNYADWYGVGFITRNHLFNLALCWLIRCWIHHEKSLIESGTMLVDTVLDSSWETAYSTWHYADWYSVGFIMRNCILNVALCQMIQHWVYNQKLHVKQSCLVTLISVSPLVINKGGSNRSINISKQIMHVKVCFPICFG